MASQLISQKELAALLQAPAPPVVIDVRWNLGGPPGRDEYDAGHIVGAHFVDLETELAGPPGVGGRHPLPVASVITATLRRCGVDDSDDEVIVYDARPSVSAARAWWVFRDAGLVNVRVLDGGFAAWTAAGGAVTADPPTPGTGRFTATRGLLPRLEADEVLPWLETGTLVDVRAPERYLGKVEPIDPVAGHIPGSINLPTTGNVWADGRFLPVPELRRRFVEAGLAVGRRIAVSCGSGVTAAHTVLALHEAGLDAVLYPGSWSEWIVDPSRPVATG